MDDEEIALVNFCTDLVGLKKLEAFPARLLGTKRPGEWVSVCEFCLQVGVAGGELKPDLFATWLPDPMARSAYAVIMFYDDELKWSMAAHYNRDRLQGDRPTNQELQATTLARSAPASSVAQQPASAAELQR